MQQELKNIFVPFELAKLAYEKGFCEWCAGVDFDVVNSKEPTLANTIGMEKNGEEADSYIFDFDFFPNVKNKLYGVPTHLQLILWLKNTHNIDVTMSHNGLWSVLDSQGTLIYQNDECFFEINQALEIGLKLVEP